MLQVDETTSFAELGLDDRLLKAVSVLGFRAPTLVQEKSIPLALAGKDVLVKARTGSGKTAAYALPTLQKLLSEEANAARDGPRAVVLVPTRELVEQVCFVALLHLDHSGRAA